MENGKRRQTQAKKQAALSPAKIAIRLLIYALILAAILFGSAGRLDWVLGWAWLGLHTIVLLAPMVFMPLDPELLEERTTVKAGIKTWDKWLVLLIQPLMPVGILILAGLDLRYDWSPALPPWLTWLALVLTALGYLFSTWASSVNKFYARFVRVQTERGHHVISDGPYRFVRHPGYLGIIVFVLATAAALDSLWALVLSGALSIILIIRTALEDKLLLEELPGYKEFIQKTRYRLLPGIW